MKGKIKIVVAATPALVNPEFSNWCGEFIGQMPKESIAGLFITMFIL